LNQHQAIPGIHTSETDRIHHGVREEGSPTTAAIAVSATAATAPAATTTATALGVIIRRPTFTPATPTPNAAVGPRIAAGAALQEASATRREHSASPSLVVRPTVAEEAATTRPTPIIRTNSAAIASVT
jgi:hypothetical protein